MQWCQTDSSCHQCLLSTNTKQNKPKKCALNLSWILKCHSSLQKKFHDISVAIVTFFPQYFKWPKVTSWCLRSIHTGHSRRCVTVADKSIPLSNLTKQGLNPGLCPSQHTARMLKAERLTAGCDRSETRRQEERGKWRAKAESGSASRLVKSNEIFPSYSRSQSWLIIHVYPAPPIFIFVKATGYFAQK